MQKMQKILSVLMFMVTLMVGIWLAGPRQVVQPKTEPVVVQPPAAAQVQTEPVYHFRDYYTKPFFADNSEIEVTLFEPLRKQYKKLGLRVVRMTTGAGPQPQTYMADEVTGYHLMVEVEGHIDNCIEANRLLEQAPKLIIHEGTSYQASHGNYGNHLMRYFAPISVSEKTTK